MVSVREITKTPGYSLVSGGGGNVLPRGHPSSIFLIIPRQYVERFGPVQVRNDQVIDFEKMGTGPFGNACTIIRSKKKRLFVLNQ